MDRTPVRGNPGAAMSRLMALLCVTLATLAFHVTLTGAAGAHGGQRVLRTVAGPYAVEAVVSRAGDVIDETIDLTDAATSRTVAGASVSLSLERHGDPSVGPFVAQESGGRYEVRYPPPPGDHWSVLIRIQGPAGDGEARHAYRAPSDGRLWSGRTATVLNVLVLIVIGSIPFVLPRLSRIARGPRAERSDDSPRPAT